MQRQSVYDEWRAGRTAARASDVGVSPQVASRVSSHKFADVGQKAQRDMKSIRTASWLTSDPEIAARVRAALTHDPIEALSNLSVDVSRGRVEVRGQVEGELAHARALAVIASIPGVRALQDRLLVIR
jgi:osmotically-inducible protein OsmY